MVETAVFLIALALVGGLASLFRMDRPLPYRWCNECDGELLETGWCQVCRKRRPY